MKALSNIMSMDNKNVPAEEAPLVAPPSANPTAIHPTKATQKKVTPKTTLVTEATTHQVSAPLKDQHRRHPRHGKCQRRLVRAMAWDNETT